MQSLVAAVVEREGWDGRYCRSHPMEKTFLLLIMSWGRLKGNAQGLAFLPGEKESRGE